MDVGCKNKEKIMKWEYKTIKLEASGFMGGKLDEKTLDLMMNDLGDKGWELAAAFDTNQQAGITRDAIIIFKRNKE
jgi:hypothetical protein